MKKGKIKFPKIPFNYGFFIALWEDIESDPSWKEMGDIMKLKPALCISTGWLVKKTDDVHIFMSDFNFKKVDFSLGDGGSTIVIPSCNILKLVKVNINV